MSQTSAAPPPLLSVDRLVVEFPLDRRRTVHAVSGVSFRLGEGETLGLVGESGCGKSTLARAVVQLLRPTSGKIWFRGEDVCRLRGEPLRAIRPHLQMIFQDAVASLNPGRCVGGSIAEPLRVMGGHDRRSRDIAARQMMVAVGLDAERHFHRKPFEFSGGQCQRICIARALMTRPQLLVCDEPVSALDVSIQAQILNLLASLKERYGLSLIFISHDLAVVKNICDRVAVMYLGKLCEIAAVDALFNTPCHPYTAALLAAHPEPDPDRPPATGDLVGMEIPSPVDPPAGCRFHTRCPAAQPVCSVTEPDLREVATGSRVACHFPLSAAG
ncbi:MAG: ATP-binding cassette domain-containing protein [Desulfosarcinaceae bacterium]|nr:ATP-binding cassette domain-containing protein [Desulfosarcinaceae bacterium]